MSDFDLSFEDAMKALHSAGVSFTCNSCGKDNWMTYQLADKFNIPLLCYTPSPSGPFSELHTVQMQCLECGYLRLYSAAFLIEINKRNKANSDASKS
ncbi:hypothetical protein AAFM71_17035 [Chromobacterium violaceum]|uniref:hypothetical protein n=1 Tax=Chromobacterium violaceum TaxID=536 RepID=UPI00385F4776